MAPVVRMQLDEAFPHLERNVNGPCHKPSWNAFQNKRRQFFLFFLFLHFFYFMHSEINRFRPWNCLRLWRGYQKLKMDKALQWYSICVCKLLRYTITIIITCNYIYINYNNILSQPSMPLPLPSPEPMWSFPLPSYSPALSLSPSLRTSAGSARNSTAVQVESGFLPRRRTYPDWRFYLRTSPPGGLGSDLRSLSA